MARLVSYRQGDRSEYLAQFIMSALAITVPIPRQEDAEGLDFHCSLLRKENKILIPYLPFNVQIKSYSEELKKNGVEFGGFTKAGISRKHEIDQLISMDTPFLIGVVNKEKQWMDLFSTNTRYFAVVDWEGKLNACNTVALIPYQAQESHDIGCGEVVDLPQSKIAKPKPKKAKGDDVLENDSPKVSKKVWRIPLGQPICRITTAEVEDDKNCERIKQLLEPHLRIDQQNSVQSRIGLGYFEWPLVIETGKPLQKMGVAVTFGSPQRESFKKQSEVLCKVLADRLSSYRSAGIKQEILRWEPVLQSLPLGQANGLVQKMIEDSLDFAKR